MNKFAPMHALIEGKVALVAFDMATNRAPITALRDPDL